MEIALKNRNVAAIDSAKSELAIAGEEYFNKNYNPEVDKVISKEMLKLYSDLIPEEERISIFKVIAGRFKGNSDAFVDACFKYSIFSSKDKFNDFLKKPNLNKIEKDWMVLYAYSVRKGLLNTAQSMQEINKTYTAAHKVWVKGMIDLKLAEGKAIYPDANSTLRLTYGKVLSYEPADGAVYSYYTTLKGVMEKENPNNLEFVVPAKLKDLYKKKDFGQYAMKNGEMPICFITNTDNTGGNSGSPVFNGKGELIGTAFDRNYEGLTGDIAFRPSSQRAACVDIRYILFIIDKFAGASYLINELSINEN